MKRKRIDTKAKQAFLLDNIWAIQVCVEKNLTHDKWPAWELIEGARRKLKYSEKTTQVDIYTGLLIAWKKLRNKNNLW